MGTHYQGKKEETRALDTYIKLMRSVESMTYRLSRELRSDSEWLRENFELSPSRGTNGKGKRKKPKKFKLTLSQLGVLESLLHLGPMCQSALGTKLLKSSGNITMVVDNLQFWGLVERRSTEGDRRYKTVHLTEKGEELICKLFPRHVSHIVDELSALSGKEQEQLAKLCRKLGLSHQGED